LSQPAIATDALGKGNSRQFVKFADSPFASEMVRQPGGLQAGSRRVGKGEGVHGTFHSRVSVQKLATGSRSSVCHSPEPADKNVCAPVIGRDVSERNLINNQALFNQRLV